MDVVTAIMFGVMAIVFEQILVEFAKDIRDLIKDGFSTDDWEW